jgi:hypothetical protein
MIEDWNPIETTPKDRKILVKTVTGLERIVKVPRHGSHSQPGHIHCWRADGHTGDLQAVAWKELDE